MYNRVFDSFFDDHTAAASFFHSRKHKGDGEPRGRCALVKLACVRPTTLVLSMDEETLPLTQPFISPACRQLGNEWKRTETNSLA